MHYENVVPILGYNLMQIATQEVVAERGAIPVASEQFI